jgi:hypothetical protein
MTNKNGSKRGKSKKADGLGDLTPPLIVLRGAQVEAVYREQEVPEYRGNPLIEALPPIWTEQQVIDQLMHFPRHSDKQRALADHIRLQLIENVREFFLPQGRHLEIETKISCMLRRGLMMRNPMNWEHWRDFNNRVESMRPDATRKSFFRFKPRGFSIVGIGGMGKTTTVENIALMYPQVITHTEYRGQDFILKQLVWLKIDCPQDGSIKGLCINFFLAVDDILGTSYYKRYAAGRRTVDELIPYMARVASLHCLGVLIIDEIENLSEARSGGVDKMLNFFVQLENNIGVPFLLIGTPDAAPLLDGKFRQARRACENGDVYWERMKEVGDKKSEKELKAEKARTGEDPNPYHPDPVWNEFVRALWDYQYVRNKCELANNVLDDLAARALYDVSQGITAVAATVYLLAQRRAISRGTEVTDERVIRSVARDSQNLIREALDQLRQGKRLAPRVGLKRHIPDLDVFHTGAAAGSNGEPRSGQNGGRREDSADGDSTAQAAAQATDVSEVAGKTNEEVGHSPEPRKKSRPRKTKPGKDDLRNLSSRSGTGTEESARLKAKHIRPATEFLEEGV